MAHEIISSLHNPRVKEIVRLRQRSGRRRGGPILIDGIRETTRAFVGGVEFVEVFYCRSLLMDGNAERILQQVEQRDVPCTEVSEPVFEKIHYGQRGEGLVATAIRPKLSLGDLRPNNPPLLAVVEGVEKPGNLGAILRSADAAGMDTVIAVDPATDVFGPNVIRASLGAVFCLSMVEAGADETWAWLRQETYQIVAAVPDAKIACFDVDFTGPTAIVFGSEAAGLSNRWTRGEIVATSIPMQGSVDSLNVSATAAVFFFEARRQRSRHGQAGA